MVITFRKFRFALLPFAWIYGMIVRLRNFFFDKGILHSVEFNLPVVCVGNLSTGGTGKTPMVELVIRSLETEYRVAVLSRGYKRKTKGFLLADKNSDANEIGDEPMQIHQKYTNAVVAVSEDRLVAIPEILREKPETQVIILDDAFQHRSVRAGLNILLTSYTLPYSRDYFLPAGNLRDSRSSSLRADVIIVTKCPSSLTVPESEAFIRELNPSASQEVFFTSIQYKPPRHLFRRSERKYEKSTAILLVTGIADPSPLIAALKREKEDLLQLSYGDHHPYVLKDIVRIKQVFNEIQREDKMIITTEKDGVRLLKFEDELKDLPIYVLPVEHHFLFDREVVFNNLLVDFVKKNHLEKSGDI